MSDERDGQIRTEHVNLQAIKATVFDPNGEEILAQILEKSESEYDTLLELIARPIRITEFCGTLAAAAKSGGTTGPKIPEKPQQAVIRAALRRLEKDYGVAKVRELAETIVDLRDLMNRKPLAAK